MAAPINPPGIIRRCERHGIYIALDCPHCLQDRLDREQRARATALLVLVLALSIGLLVLLGGWPSLS